MSESTDRVRSTLLTEARVAQAARTPESGARSLLALMRLSRLVHEPTQTQQEREALLAKARSRVMEYDALDATTFSDLARLFGGSEELRAWVDKGSAFIGAGMSAASGYVGLVAPGVGATLGALGAAAPLILPELARPGYDLRTLSAPDTTGLQIQEFQRFISQNIEAISSEFGPSAMKVVLSDPELARELGYDIEATTGKLVITLSPAAREAVGALLDSQDGGGSKAEAREAEKALLESLRSSTKVATNLNEVIAREVEVRQKAEASRLAAEAEERARREIVAALQLVDTIADVFFPNSTAQRIVRTANAIASIASAVSQFGGAIGVFGLANSMAGGFRTLVDLFDSAQADPTGLILNAIEELDRHLTEQLQHLSRMVAILDTRQTYMVAQLDRLLEETRENRRFNESRFLEVLDAIGFAYSKEAEEDRAEQRAELNALARDAARAEIDDVPLALGRLFTYATVNSRLPSMTGSPAFLTGFPRWRMELQARRDPELTFGLLPALLGSVGVVVDVGDLTADGGLVPNPAEWARGSLAYLEARAFRSDLPASDDMRSDTARLLQVGRDLQQLVRSVTSPDALKRAASVLGDMTGVDADSTTGNDNPANGDTAEPPRLTLQVLLAVLLREYEDRHLHPWRVEAVTPETPAFQEGHVFWRAKVNDVWATVRTTSKDPLRTALDRQLLKVVKQSQGPYGTLETAEVQVGSLKQAVVPYWTLKGNGAGHSIAGPHNANMALRSIKSTDTLVTTSQNAVFGTPDPVALVSRAWVPRFLQRLVREQLDFPTIFSSGPEGLVSFLKDRLERDEISLTLAPGTPSVVVRPKAFMEELGLVAVATQVQLGLTRWRRSTSPSGTGEFAFENMPVVLGTVNEVLREVEAILGTDTAQTEEWVDALLDRIEASVTARLSEDVRRLQTEAVLTASVPEWKTLPLLDTVLDRITVFMHVFERTV